MQNLPFSLKNESYLVVFYPFSSMFFLPTYSVMNVQYFISTRKEQEMHNTIVINF